MIFSFFLYSDDHISHALRGGTLKLKFSCTRINIVTKFLRNIHFIFSKRINIII